MSPQLIDSQYSKKHEQNHRNNNACRSIYCSADDIRLCLVRSAVLFVLFTGSLLFDLFHQIICTVGFKRKKGKAVGFTVLSLIIKAVSRRAV